MKTTESIWRGLAVSLLLLTGCNKQEIQTPESEKTASRQVLQADWEPGDPIIDGTWWMAHYSTLKAISVFGNSTADGAPIHQWQYKQTTGQKWEITKVDDTYYSIINVNSGKALEVPDGQPVSGVQLQQNPYDGSDKQLWEIFHQGYTVYRINNKATSYGVTLDGLSPDDGAMITQEPVSGDGSQYWFFTNLDSYFNNPLLAGGPDPWVAQRDGFYYYMHTTGGNITIRKTANMSELRDAPATVVWTPPSGTPYSHNLWAPELHFLDGKWYVYFAADDGNDANHRMYVLENASADPSDIWAIDGTVLEHGGQRYFIWSGWRTQDPSQSGIQQLYIAHMSNPWTITGPRTLISEPEHAWERNGLVNEGPVALKNAGGEVFVIYSSSGCWTDEYKLGQLKLTGSDPLLKASWTKKSTPVFQKHTGNSVYGPGHNSFFKSPDGTEDWILYHAQSESGLGCSGSRSPRMQKFTWTAGGEPDFGVPEATSTALVKPSGE